MIKGVCKEKKAELKCDHWSSSELDQRQIYTVDSSLKIFNHIALMTLQADTDKLVELFLSLASTSQESGIAIIHLFERFKLRPYQLEEFEGNPWVSRRGRGVC